MPIILHWLSFIRTKQCREEYATIMPLTCWFLRVISKSYIQVMFSSVDNLFCSNVAPTAKTHQCAAQQRLTRIMTDFSQQSAMFGETCCAQRS